MASQFDMNISVNALVCVLNTSAIDRIEKYSRIFKIVRGYTLKNFNCQIAMDWSQFARLNRIRNSDNKHHI